MEVWTKKKFKSVEDFESSSECFLSFQVFKLSKELFVQSLQSPAREASAKSFVIYEIFLHFCSIALAAPTLRHPVISLSRPLRWKHNYGLIAKLNHRSSPANSLSAACEIHSRKKTSSPSPLAWECAEFSGRIDH